MNIDSHVHFWKFDKQRDIWINNEMKVLREDYLPEHLMPTLKRNEIDAVVAVQVDQTELETLFLVELAKTHPVIKGVVGWIDFKSPDIVERLNYFSQFPIIKGWRHIVQGERDDFLAGEEFRRGISALAGTKYTYDVLIYEQQLPAAIDFVAAFPDQQFIIDHCAKPAVRNRDITEWEKGIREIATNPNVYCKLSGLFTEARWKDWSAADFYPYFDVVFDAFGTNRILFGSDWPVMLLSGIYVQWKSLVEKYMENFTIEDREQVFGGNATQFYKL